MAVFVVVMVPSIGSYVDPWYRYGSKCLLLLSFLTSFFEMCLVIITGRNDPFDGTNNSVNMHVPQLWNKEV